MLRAPVARSDLSPWVSREAAGVVQPGGAPSGAGRRGWPRAPTPAGGLPAAPASPHGAPARDCWDPGTLAVPSSLTLLTGLEPSPTHSSAFQPPAPAQAPVLPPQTQAGGLGPHLRTSPLSLVTLPSRLCPWRGTEPLNPAPLPCWPPLQPAHPGSCSSSPHLSGLLGLLAPEHLGCWGI